MDEFYSILANAIKDERSAKRAIELLEKQYAHADAQAARIAELEHEVTSLDCMFETECKLRANDKSELQARLGEMTAAWEQAVKVAVDREKQIAELTSRLEKCKCK